MEDVVFDDDDEVRQLVKRLIGPLGRRLDESAPMVDARLPDGSRLNAAIPPATTRWCCVTVRKFILRAHSLEELVALGTLPSRRGALPRSRRAGGDEHHRQRSHRFRQDDLDQLPRRAIASPDERW